MKSLIIIGPTRSGKTTLAEMICEKYRFSKIELDQLVLTFQEVFPDCGIGNWVENSEERLAPFIFGWINRLAKKTYRPTRYVMEGCQMDLQTAFDSIDHENVKIVVLGYPGLSPEEALAGIRKNDKYYDWSLKESDERMLWELREYGIEKSKCLLSQCETLGIKFIDVGRNRAKKLEEFVKNLETFL